MSYFIYILLCNQKTFYVGSTDNVERRLREHRAGKSFFTRQFSDIQVLYKEEYASKKLAESRERQLKGWSVAKKKALIAKDVETLKRLSKSTGSGEVLLSNVW